MKQQTRPWTKSGSPYPFLLVIIVIIVILALIFDGIFKNKVF